MGGFPIRQPFPSHYADRIDPFLLLHHANVSIPKDVDPRHTGVDPHPHRGFSPVTFIFKGGVHHRDSRGNNSIVYAGGAQWMNAGRGVIHSERPPHDIHNIGGQQEIIQLWINLPARNKMDQPSYYPIAADQVPVYQTPDKLASAKVVAGDLFGLKGPVPTLTPVNAATIELSKGASLEIAVPSNHNAFIYFLDGKVNLKGYGLTEGLHAAVFAKDGDGIFIEALEETHALLLTGEPLNEEVVSHGPFVMNNETQILEAMRDYQMGKMGVLIED